MSRSRGTMRSDLQRKISASHQRLIKMTRELTGADSAMMKEAAAVLQKSIRQQLSVKATGLRQSLKTRRTRGDPSAPGESPRQITGALRRGIRSKVVDGERVVRAENFRSKIMEFGFVAPAVSSRPTRYAVFGKKARKNQGVTKATHARTMAPRPFMRPGLEAAKPELAKKGAQILRDEVKKALAVPLAGGSGGN